MEEAGTSGKLIFIYQTVRHHIPEDSDTDGRILLNTTSKSTHFVNP
jgi:hypothetical protein